jgi:hypothetical protein
MAVAAPDNAMSLEAQFLAAVTRISQAESDKSHKKSLERYTMELYGLQEQANKGDNTTDRPRTSMISCRVKRWLLIHDIYTYYCRMSRKPSRKGKMVR